jgi:hypothetical protein
MTLTVYERKNGRKHYPLILKGMNARFRSKEQFELQLDTICLDIAQELGGKYDRQGDDIFFDFTGLNYLYSNRE